MWLVVDSAESVARPLAIVNAEAEIEKQLRGHDVTHGGAEYPFCEDYGCGSLLAIRDALHEPEIE